MPSISPCSFFFFFNDTATTEIYTLSLHDALPIFVKYKFGHEVLNFRPYAGHMYGFARPHSGSVRIERLGASKSDRKSTRLNSSHLVISYAVFCLKKKK